MNNLIYNFPSLAYINLNNLYQNCVNLKSHIVNKTKRDIKFMAVVKADGYGHSAIECTKELIKAGASYFAVATLFEAIELRKIFSKLDILILGVSIHPLDAKFIIDNNLTSTVTNFKIAKALNDYAFKNSKICKVHIKTDTGMGRAGQFISKTVNLIKKILELKNIYIEGIYSHLSSADSSLKDYSYFQRENFLNLITSLEKQKILISIKHLANSAAIIDMPNDFSFNMVRAGISLYGFYPSFEVNNSEVKLYPVLSLKSRIGSIKIFEKDKFISYSRTYKTDEKCKIVVIPIGYADGFSRLNSNNGSVLINGKIFPIVGRVCMDAIMAKLPVNERVKLYQEVTLIGQDENSIITADDVAKRTNTINYEITCNISKRVPRVFIKDNKICKIKLANQEIF